MQPHVLVVRRHCKISWWPVDTGSDGHYAIKGSRDHMAGVKCDGVIKPDIYSLAISSDWPNKPINLSLRVSEMINEGATVETVETVETVAVSPLIRLCNMLQFQQDLDCEHNDRPPLLTGGISSGIWPTVATCTFFQSTSNVVLNLCHITSP